MKKKTRRIIFVFFGHLTRREWHGDAEYNDAEFLLICLLFFCFACCSYICQWVFSLLLLVLFFWVALDLRRVFLPPFEESQYDGGGK